MPAVHSTHDLSDGNPTRKNKQVPKVEKGTAGRTCPEPTQTLENKLISVD